MRSFIRFASRAVIITLMQCTRTMDQIKCHASLISDCSLNMEIHQRGEFASHKHYINALIEKGIFMQCHVSDCMSRIINQRLQFERGNSSQMGESPNHQTLKKELHGWGEPTNPNTSKMKQQVVGLHVFARRNSLVKVCWHPSSREQTCTSEAKQMDGHDGKSLDMPCNCASKYHREHLSSPTHTRKRRCILVTGTSEQIPQKIRTPVKCYREDHVCDAPRGYRCKGPMHPNQAWSQTP